MKLFIKIHNLSLKKMHFRWFVFLPYGVRFVQASVLQLEYKPKAAGSTQAAYHGTTITTNEDI